MSSSPHELHPSRGGSDIRRARRIADIRLSLETNAPISNRSNRASRRPMMYFPHHRATQEIRGASTINTNGNGGNEDEIPSPINDTTVRNDFLSGATYPSNANTNASDDSSSNMNRSTTNESNGDSTKRPANLPSIAHLDSLFGGENDLPNANTSTVGSSSNNVHRSVANERDGGMSNRSGNRRMLPPNVGTASASSIGTRSNNLPERDESSIIGQTETSDDGMQEGLILNEDLVASTERRNTDVNSNVSTVGETSNIDNFVARIKSEEGGNRSRPRNRPIFRYAATRASPVVVPQRIEPVEVGHFGPTRVERNTDSGNGQRSADTGGRATELASNTDNSEIDTYSANLSRAVLRRQRRQAWARAAHREERLQEDVILNSHEAAAAAREAAYGHGVSYQIATRTARRYAIRSASRSNAHLDAAIARASAISGHRPSLRHLPPSGSLPRTHRAHRMDMVLQLGLRDFNTFRRTNTQSRNVSQLPTRYYNAEAEAHRPLESRKCVVCLDEYKNGDLLIRLPCFHEMHNDCVVGYLRSHNGGKCPVCRHPVTQVEPKHERQTEAENEDNESEGDISLRDSEGDIVVPDLEPDNE